MTGRDGETPWGRASMPDLTGLSFVVTGANSGLGWHTGVALAGHGGHVVMACRDLRRGREAVAELRRRVPDAGVDLVRLDLADLASVREVAAELLATYPRLDVLVCNAGVMGGPRRTTVDGFEAQFGTNHLGHFALTGLLLPALLAAGRAGVAVLGGPARVVTVSSMMHRAGRLNREDPMHAGSYRPARAYGQSKLANLLFMRELAYRAARAGVPLASLAAHPGWAATNLQAAGPALAGRRLLLQATGLGNRLFAQSAEQGALPTLRAATDPLARSGGYYGPRRLARGAPVPAGMARQALDDADATWLWQRSAELTGVTYAELEPPAAALAADRPAVVRSEPGPAPTEQEVSP